MWQDSAVAPADTEALRHHRNPRNPQERTVSPVYPFHSINEVLKPASQRVYHNNDACPPGRDIPSWERKQGTNNYRLCEDCARRNR